jgi:hypothetical protein
LPSSASTSIPPSAPPMKDTRMETRDNSDIPCSQRRGSRARRGGKATTKLWGEENNQSEHATSTSPHFVASSDVKIRQMVRKFVGLRCKLVACQMGRCQRATSSDARVRRQ